MITALSATPPVATAATAQDRAELLLRLQQRRSELIDALAVGLVDVQDRPLAPSIVAPLAVVQAAIDAVAAELVGATASGGAWEGLAVSGHTSTPWNTKWP